MNIRGLVTFSLVDYPGKISCVIFTGNCNFRCPYCQNPCLIFDPESQPLITEIYVLNFLKSRKGKLDGIVITGGEPTIREKLPSFAAKVKQLGFLVKIDTNAGKPEVIINMHENGLVDFLGLDYKAPLDKYNEIIGVNIPDISNKVKKLFEYVTRHNIPYDVRTTVHKALLSPEDLEKMWTELQAMGISKWTLQQFNPVEIIDDSLIEEPTYTDRELVDIAASIDGSKRIKVRGLHGMLS